MRAARISSLSKSMFVRSLSASWCTLSWWLSDSWDSRLALTSPGIFDLGLLRELEKPVYLGGGTRGAESCRLALPCGKYRAGFHCRHQQTEQQKIHDSTAWRWLLKSYSGLTWLAWSYCCAMNPVEPYFKGVYLNKYHSTSLAGDFTGQRRSLCSYTVRTRPYSV